ncbi:MAG: radical SAM protein [Bacteroidetes bacterium]|nr:radical SAM protein [Bacteroidota bacterium]
MRFWKNKKPAEGYHPLDNNIVKEYNKTRGRDKRKYLCHAPFKSMTFFFEGDVMACWHNKQFLIGKLPDQSVEEIWFGQRLQTLRNHILSNDLSCGCTDCRRFFNQHHYSAAGAWRYDYLPESGSGYPVSMDFQISNLCNLECIMCNGEYSVSVRQNREMKSPYSIRYDEKFVSQLEPFIPHLKEASFTGGEALMIKIYYDIWERMIELNPAIRISVTTNGAVLNERMKGILEKLNFNITVSIDSVSKKTYENIRRNAVFEEVMDNFDYYLHYTRRKGTVFSVRVCPMKQNWHEIPEIFRFMNDHEVVLIFNTVIFPPYSALWNQSPVILAEIYDYLKSYEFSAHTDIQKENILAYNYLVKQVEGWVKESDLREKQHPGILTYDTDKLLSVLFGQVDDFLKTTSFYSSEEKVSFSLFFRKGIEACEKSITDIEALNRALRFYIGIPPNRLVDEFNIRDVEKIIERTLQAGRAEV